MDIILPSIQMLVILLVVLLINYCIKKKIDKSIYYLYLSHFEFGETYLSAIASDSWLWHRRLGHVSMDSIKKLVSLELVWGLPTKKYELEGLCDA
jgi:GAG-pre-integrase domain